MSSEKSSLERLRDQVNNLLENYKDDAMTGSVVLSGKPFEQWRSLKDNFKGLDKEYSFRRDSLNGKILDIVVKYRNDVMIEIVEKLEFIRDMLKDDRLPAAIESLSSMIVSLKKMNSKIETDLGESNNNFENIVNQCFIQGKRMYTDIRMIANSSRMRIYDGKPQAQMLKLDIPEEKEISEEASKLSIKSEIEHGLDELKELIKSGAEEKQIIKRARIIIGSEHLLHRYIKQETIQVKVYKIDLNRDNSSYKREDAERDKHKNRNG